MQFIKRLTSRVIGKIESNSLLAKIENKNLKYENKRLKEEIAGKNFTDRSMRVCRYQMGAIDMKDIRYKKILEDTGNSKSPDELIEEERKMVDLIYPSSNTIIKHLNALSFAQTEHMGGYVDDKEKMAYARGHIDAYWILIEWLCEIKNRNYQIKAERKVSETNNNVFPDVK